MLQKTGKMPVVKDAHIVKIAVELENQQPQLIEFNQRHPLTGIIQDLCNNWNVTDANIFALQFCEPNNKNYVTEKNRHEVKNGSVLRLRHSPAKTAADILEIIRTNNSTTTTTTTTTTTNDEKTKVLENLSTLSSDLTFALEFIKEQGLNIIITMIEDEKSCTNDMLKYVIRSFVELMEHGTVSWDILQPIFLMRNIHFINSPSKYPHEIIQSALSVLENTVHNSTKSAQMIEKEITFSTLLKLLQESAQPVIQQNTIALINALFIKANDLRRRSIATTFSTKEYRSVILNSVITSTIGTEMAHQLYILQTLTMGLIEERMLTKMNSQDQDAMDKIKELRRIAFDDGIGGGIAASGGSGGGGSGSAGNISGGGDGIIMNTNSSTDSRRQNSTYYKKLGFKCDINPAQDFIEIPPGILALDCMVYFARNYTQNYTKVVHENSCRADEHECPFGRTSIELVKLLCEILHIGEPPNEQGQEFHPMFFTHDHPFEEFFCVCIVVLNKTWKDMRATNEDFAKVFSVVREQITRSLRARPGNLDDFKTKIQSLTYANITALRQQERTSKEECESTASAIVSLKEKITPEIMNLIKAQRLGYLVEGTRFSKYSRGVRSKDKFWYARLSPNHKVIHYGDCDEKSVPILEELSNKVLVIDIKQLLVGKECPHMKEMRARKSAINLGFSITFDNMDNATLDFVAPDESTFYYWTDGINALLAQPMISKQKEEDFETLLSMEIKLRLLDTEGVDISKEPPPIPDEPDNYDFCFEMQPTKLINRSILQHFTTYII